MTSFFEPIDLLPEDPILSIPSIFAKDQNPKKVNLGIGIYQNAEGSSYVLPSVKKAEQALVAQALKKDYLPIDGDAQYLKSVFHLVFGSTHAFPNDTIYAAQTIGGTGALSLAAVLMKEGKNDSIALSDPSWPNHLLIFKKAGLNLINYPYQRTNQQQLEFSDMCQTIKKLPPGTAVLLHACCHNPTGVDPSMEQWKELSELIKKQKLMPFFDLAYQGFGDDLERDVKALRYFADQGHELLVAVSFSKNFGLYGERVGALFAFTNHAETKRKLATHVKQIIRSYYSNPPLHGVRLVSTILQSEELLLEWKKELSSMSTRIQKMRKLLQDGLMQKQSTHDFSYLSQQKGFFSRLNFNPKQIQFLRNEKGIYLVENGRINIAGLNEKNSEYVIDSFVNMLNL